MKRSVEDSLRRAVAELPHPSAGEIWEQPLPPPAPRDYVAWAPPPRRVRSMPRRAVLAFACLCFCFFAGAGWFNWLRVDAVIDLDVNPSFSISVNRGDRVLDVKGWNEDAERLLAEYPVKEKDLDDTIEALCRALRERAYLTPDKPAVLLTIESGDAERAGDLGDEVSEAIGDAAKDWRIEPLVIRRTVPDRAPYAQQALQYGVSPGKILYTGELASRNPALTMEQLTAMPVGDLVSHAGWGDDEEDDIDDVDGADDDDGWGDDEEDDIDDVDGAEDDDGRDDDDGRNGVHARGAVEETHGEDDDPEEEDDDDPEEEDDDDGFDSPDKIESREDGHNEDGDDPDQDDDDSDDSDRDDSDDSDDDGPNEDSDDD